jgi:hypothetical protein
MLLLNQANTTVTRASTFADIFAGSGGWQWRLGLGPFSLWRF